MVTGSGREGGGGGRSNSVIVLKGKLRQSISGLRLRESNYARTCGQGWGLLPPPSLVLHFLLLSYFCLSFHHFSFIPSPSFFFFSNSCFLRHHHRQQQRRHRYPLSLMTKERQVRQVGLRGSGELEGSHRGQRTSVEAGGTFIGS